MRLYVFLFDRLCLPLFLIAITPFASYMLGFVIPLSTIPLPVRGALFARLECDLTFIETHLAVDPLLYATAYFSGMAALLLSIPFALALLFVPWSAFSGTKIHNQPMPSHTNLRVLLLLFMAIGSFVALSILPNSSATGPNCSWFREVETANEAKQQFLQTLGLIGGLQASLYMWLWAGMMMYRKIGADRVAAHS
ncbi:hypothetical protein [Pararhizobium sp.]|uniref:hypothetical protein n=1 Tax=Pararhizobium sp. TaxID=1977563 RepID=UPI003D0FFAB8